MENKRKEGRKKGRKKGRKEGRKEGRKGKGEHKGGREHMSHMKLFRALKQTGKHCVYVFLLNSSSFLFTLDFSFFLFCFILFLK